MQKITTETDVLVAGGGSAGIVAAIQSARLGVRTDIIEYTGQLGGTTTNGGVCCFFYFWSRHKQIIAGIGWELVNKSLDLDGGKLPPFQMPNPTRPSYGVVVNGHTYAAIIEEEALKAGVVLHYHEFPRSVSRSSDRWIVQTVGRGIERTIRCSEIIDCTGGADLVGLAGFARVRGEANDPERRHPGTLAFGIGGYDVSTLNEADVQKQYDAALASGLLQPGDFWNTRQPFMAFLRVGGGNAQHIFHADDTTSELQTDANIRARASVLRLLRFIRTLPGCQNARLQHMRADTAVRETYRIVGETTISYNDYISGRRFPDALANTLYFIDVHTHDGVVHEFLPDHVIPTIPLSALVPKGSSHILAAGRCISSDRKANSALRVQASCMAMGQAAGAAAAIGVRTGTASRNVPLDEIRQTLRQHGAIVPE